MCLAVENNKKKKKKFNYFVFKTIKIIKSLQHNNNLKINYTIIINNKEFTDQERSCLNHKHIEHIDQLRN